MTEFEHEIILANQMYEILGDIVANNNSSTLTEIAEQSRAQQMKQNKFSKDNPYPQTKE